MPVVFLIFVATVMLLLVSNAYTLHPHPNCLLFLKIFYLKYSVHNVVGIQLKFFFFIFMFTVHSFHFKICSEVSDWYRLKLKLKKPK